MAFLRFISWYAAIQYGICVKSETWQNVQVAGLSSVLAKVCTEETALFDVLSALNQASALPLIRLVREGRRVKKGEWSGD